MFWNNPNLSKVAFSFERFKLRANFSGTQPFKDQKSLRKVLHYFGMNLNLSKVAFSFERFKLWANFSGTQPFKDQKSL